MKPRFFESYFNADPMVELTEMAAHEAGTYVLEDGGPMRRYRRFIDNELRTLIYADWTEPTNAIIDMKSLDADVPAEIYSPVEPSGDGYRWRVWYVTPAGEVRKILERYYDAARDVQQENVRDLDDHLVSYTVYHYHDGGLYELTTHAPDGTVTSRRDV